MGKEIILASNSIRRKELLKYIFEDFKIIVSNIDEEKILRQIISLDFKDNLEKFSKICDEIARKKGEQISIENQNSVVISADTIVYDEFKIFGKPKDLKDAINTLEYLSGKEHIVQTSVCIYYNGKCTLFNEKTKVVFNELDNFQKNLIKDYVENEKPYDKAGAYGIQEKAVLLIKEFSGDYFNIVGLPVSKLNRVLNEMGII